MKTFTGKARLISPKVMGYVRHWQRAKETAQEMSRQRDFESASVWSAKARAYADEVCDILAAADGSAFGVRVRHHAEHFSDALYYWYGGSLVVESRRARKNAMTFESVKSAVAMGEHIREWLKDSYPIEYQVCRLPSWRLVKRSMPNTKLRHRSRDCDSEKTNRHERTKDYG